MYTPIILQTRTRAYHWQTMAAQHELSKMVRSHNGRLYHRPNVVLTLLTTEEAENVPWGRAANVYVSEPAPPFYPHAKISYYFPRPVPFLNNRSGIPFNFLYLDRIEHDRAAEAFAVLNIKNPRALGVELPKELVGMIYRMAIHE